MKTLLLDQHSNATKFMKAPKQSRCTHRWGFEQTLTVSPQRVSPKFKPAPPPSSTIVQLELEALNCFETVENQFDLWGITFKNAIALQPSNPAFITKPDQVVLMSGPNSGFVEIHFHHPLRYIEARIISSQSTILSAFNADNQEIASTQTPPSESRTVTASVLPPTLLKIQAEDIYKVMFSTFDGQLIIDHLKLHF